MSYTVLARKYRSRTFEDVIGQDAVTTTLRNAIRSSRVHHGYLFCGTRGVGKTSLARILAKSLNCLSFDAPTLEPCGTCDSCRGIAAGEDIDVIEIDAASNTGVDNIRELRNNAVYRPARARFKVYIIDEVHMLSTGAFNALLKTLEEPPGHVKFIFATTEAQKVPATIQSRCQRFDFRPIESEQIADRLAHICTEEKIKADPAALRRIARLANGSLRDGVSLLDQMLSMCGAELTAEVVDQFLPAPYDELLADVIDRLAECDTAAALQAADRSLGGGQSPDQWCSAMTGQLRDLMLVRVCGAETDLVDVPAGVRARLAQQALRFEPAAYVYMISVLEELRRAVSRSGSSRALIEAALVRLSDTSKFASIESLLARLDGPAAAAGDGSGAARSTAAPARAALTAAAPSASAASLPEPAAAKKKEPLTSVADADRAAPAGRPPSAVAGPVARAPASTSAPARVAAAADARSAAGQRTPREGAAPSGRSPAPPASVAPPADAAVRHAGRPRTEDLRAAMTDPAVRQALDVFEGSIVHVQRSAAPVDASAGDAGDGDPADGIDAI